MKNKIFIIVLFLTLQFCCARFSFSCHKGPCLDLNDDCGFGGGMGTCRHDGEVCIGNCQILCPSGLPDEYCLEWIFDCTPTTVVCGTIITYKYYA